MGGGKEVAGMEVDPAVRCPFKQGLLMLRGDDAAGASAVLRVCPAIDPRDMDAEHAGHRGVPAALLDHMMGCVRHGDDIAIIATPWQAKIAISSHCELRKSPAMTSHGDWIREGLERSGKTQAELARGIGMSKDKLNKTLRGSRRLQAHEVPLVSRFLNYPPPKDLTTPDFTEDTGSLTEAQKKAVELLSGYPPDVQDKIVASFQALLTHPRQQPSED